MITLEEDALVVTFPEVHPAAVLRLDFQRTLRIPDDGRAYPLPPGLGRFPLRHVDDYPRTVPPAWGAHGGVLLPMYQAEALWVNFGVGKVGDWAPYRFAVQVATGMVNAVSGAPWRAGLSRAPQDYLVVPGQPWLDGYCVRKGIIRQFVAMPLGAGVTAEEQRTGAAVHGGLQLQVFPMRREFYERRFGRPAAHRVGQPRGKYVGCLQPDLGLGAGGEMWQEIYADPYRLIDWDQHHSRRCFVHLADSLTWQAITGEAPPTEPPTAQAYAAAGLPWFDYYDADQTALAAPAALGGLQGLGQLMAEKGEPLSANAPVTPQTVVALGPRDPRRPVREGAF